MDNLQPVFLGYNVKELWDYIHPIAFVGWGFLLVAPKWTYTYTITLIPPIIHSILYSSILLPEMLFPDPMNPPPPVDISNIESVFHIFGIPNVFFCGWVHYVVFDLLVARGIVIDAVQVLNVSYVVYYTMIVPCLLATLYVGPVGFLMYMILRLVVLVRNDNTTETKSKLS